MSLPENNDLLDLQPPSQTTVPKTPLDLPVTDSLQHYQHSDRKCISLQILPYLRPYAIPIAKVRANDDLYSVLITLPEIRNFITDKDEGTELLSYVSGWLEDGSWRLVDESGFLIRIQDWEDLVRPYARVVLDTDGARKRLTETQRVTSDEDRDNTASSNRSAKGQPSSISNKKETVTESQGDPQWLSWNQDPGTDNNEGGWNNNEPVSLIDEGSGWGDQSTHGDQTNSRIVSQHYHSGINSPTNPQASSRDSNFNSGFNEKAQAKYNWHSAQASQNGNWKKGKFPPKVHLTFFAPFQTPKKLPMKPSPPFCRFSIEIDAPMWKVAMRITASERTPFNEMKIPENHTDCEYKFIELRHTDFHGKESLEMGRERNIKGRVTMAEMGLTVDGGSEGLGR